MPHFIYKSVRPVPKKDENGNPIPLINSKGVPVAGKFETEDKEFIDSFNLNKVIRTVMVNEEKVIVLLDDGHEDTQVVPTMEKNKITEQKRRVWLQSEIEVTGSDVKELYEALKKV
jgi:hypothetical protein